VEAGAPQARRARAASNTDSPRAPNEDGPVKGPSSILVEAGAPQAGTASAANIMDSPRPPNESGPEWGRLKFWCRQLPTYRIPDNSAQPPDKSLPPQSPHSSARRSAHRYASYSKHGHPFPPTSASGSWRWSGGCKKLGRAQDSSPVHPSVQCQILRLIAYSIAPPDPGKRVEPGPVGL
jgi:hypothetical protein